MTLKQYWGNIPSNIHTAEDAVETVSFVHNGKSVLVGAVSDGCTSETRTVTKGGFRDFNESLHDTGLGARWMVRKFCQLAEQRIRTGGSGEKLIRSVVQTLFCSMTEYKPTNLHPEGFNKLNGLSFELYATLYAYIVTPEECLIFLAGNGFVFLNGREYEIDPLWGDMYPMYWLEFCEKRREEMFDQMFRIIRIPTTKIRRLTLASDGICEHQREYFSKMHNKPDTASLMRVVSDENVRFRNRYEALPYRWLETIDAVVTGHPFGTFQYCGFSCDDASHITVVNQVGGAVPQVDITSHIAFLNDVNRKQLHGLAVAEHAQRGAAPKMKQAKPNPTPTPVVTPKKDRRTRPQKVVRPVAVATQPPLLHTHHIATLKHRIGFLSGGKDAAYLVENERPVTRLYKIQGTTMRCVDEYVAGTNEPFTTPVVGGMLLRAVPAHAGSQGKLLHGDLVLLENLAPRSSFSKDVWCVIDDNQIWLKEQQRAVLTGFDPTTQARRQVTWQYAGLPDAIASAGKHTYVCVDGTLRCMTVKGVATVLLDAVPALCRFERMGDDLYLLGLSAQGLQVWRFRAGKVFVHAVVPAATLPEFGCSSAYFRGFALDEVGNVFRPEDGRLFRYNTAPKCVERFAADNLETNSWFVSMQNGFLSQTNGQLDFLELK